MDTKQAQDIKSRIHSEYGADGSTVRVHVVRGIPGKRWFQCPIVEVYECAQWVDVFDCGDGPEARHTGQPHPWPLAEIYRRHAGLDVVYFGDLPEGVIEQCVAAKEALL